MTSPENRIFTEDKSHLRILTGLRGWAALWVLIFHVYEASQHSLVAFPIGQWNINLTPFFSLGWSGVQIFFVLSGFLLSLPFAQWQAGTREKPNLERYLFRRAARVFPAYYVQLAILLGGAYLLGQASPIANVESFLRHLFMLFVPPPIGIDPINTVWWTLPIEFMFYLALPFLAGLINPRRWLLLLVLMLTSMWLWRAGTIIYTGPGNFLMSSQLPGSMDSFGMGMLGAMLHVNKNSVSAWLSRHHNLTAMAGLAILLLCLCWMQYKWMDYWNHSLIFYTWTTVYSFAVMLVAIAGMNGNRLIGWLFGNSAIVFAGVVSYSIYLWHAPLLRWLSETGLVSALQNNRLPLLLLATTVGTVAIASVSYAFIERPFIRMRR